MPVVVGQADLGTAGVETARRDDAEAVRDGHRAQRVGPRPGDAGTGHRGREEVEVEAGVVRRERRAGNPGRELVRDVREGGGVAHVRGADAVHLGCANVALRVEHRGPGVHLRAVWCEADHRDLHDPVVAREEPGGFEVDDSPRCRTRDGDPGNLDRCRGRGSRPCRRRHHRDVHPATGSAADRWPAALARGLDRAAAVAAHRGRRPGCLGGPGRLRPLGLGRRLGRRQVVGVLAGEQAHEPGVSPDPELGRDARREPLVLEPVDEVAPGRGDIAWDVADRAALDLDGDRPERRRCCRARGPGSPLRSRSGPARQARAGTVRPARPCSGRRRQSRSGRRAAGPTSRGAVPPAAARALDVGVDACCPRIRRRNDTPERPPFVFLGRTLHLRASVPEGRSAGQSSLAQERVRWFWSPPHSMATPQFVAQMSWDHRPLAACG